MWLSVDSLRGHLGSSSVNVREHQSTAVLFLNTLAGNKPVRSPLRPRSFAPTPDGPRPPSRYTRIGVLRPCQADGRYPRLQGGFDRYLRTQPPIGPALLCAPRSPPAHPGNGAVLAGASVTHLGAMPGPCPLSIMGQPPTLQPSAGLHGALDCTNVQERGGELAWVVWAIRSVGVGAAAPSERSRRRGPRF